MLLPKRKYLVCQLCFAMTALIILTHCKSPRTFGVKLPKAEKKQAKCENCKEFWDRTDYVSFSWRDKVILKTNAYSWFNTTMKTHRRNGITLEFVPYEPHYADASHCLPTIFPPGERVRNTYLLKGPILKPVYRRKLLKQWKKDKKAYKKLIRKRKIKDAEEWIPKTIQIELGKNPMPSNTDYEVNLLLLGKKRICRINHFHSFKGEKHMEFHPVPFLFQAFLDTAKFPPKISADSSLIPFEQGSAIVPEREMERAIWNMTYDSAHLVGVEIHAFASVEGDPDDNTCLATMRANRIKRRLLPKITKRIDEDEIPLSIRTRWKMFYDQIENYKGKKPLRDNEAWTKFLDENPEYRRGLEPLLEKQRIAKVYFIRKIPMTNGERQNFALKQIRESISKAFVDKNDSSKINYSAIWNALAYQGFLFEQYESGTEDNNFIDIDYPILPGFADLIFRQLDMRRKHLYGMRGNKTNISKEAAIVDSLLSMEQHNPYWRYNQLVFQINEFTRLQMTDKGIDPSELYTMIDSLRGFSDIIGDDVFEKLILNYHFQMANYSTNDENYYKYQLFSLSQIYNHYKNDTTLTEAHALKLSKLFVYGNAFEEARKILQPFIRKYHSGKKAVKVDLYTWFLKMNYFHPEEDYNGIGNIANLIKAKNYLSQEDWCKLFIQKNGLGFQPLDDVKLRDIYCQECQGELDYIEKSFANK